MFTPGSVDVSSVCINPTPTFIVYLEGNLITIIPEPPLPDCPFVAQPAELPVLSGALDVETTFSPLPAAVPPPAPPAPPAVLPGPPPPPAYVTEVPLIAEASPSPPALPYPDEEA